ncbi:MAG: AlkZ family DNA glycosylase [Armatimonadetes bacterium]|nr:AlkZ family DNA glycosylase [Armatimonadota bacterium]
MNDRPMARVTRDERKEEEKGKFVLSRDRLAGFRLMRQSLLERQPKQCLVRVVRDLCGLQAQFSSSPGLSLSARIKGISEDDLDKALYRDRTLVKIWSVRGTLHLITSEDFHIYLGALGPAMTQGVNRWMEREATGLSGEARERVDALILSALSEGPLTRKDLHRKVPQLAGLSSALWGADVRSLASRGLIVHGQPVKGRVTFVRTDQWLPEKFRTPLPEEQARKLMLLRYLGTYGPATVQDMAHWSGLRVGAVRSLLEGLTGAVTSVQVEGEEKEYAARGTDVSCLKTWEQERELPVRYLPCFDALLLAYRNKAGILSEEYRKKVFRPAAWVEPTLLVRGRVAGIWAGERRSGKLRITASPFERLSKKDKEALREEAGNVASYLNSSLEGLKLL